MIRTRILSDQLKEDNILTRLHYSLLIKLLRIDRVAALNRWSEACFPGRRMMTTTWQLPRMTWTFATSWTLSGKILNTSAGTRRKASLRRGRCVSKPYSDDLRDSGTILFFNLYSFSLNFPALLPLSPKVWSNRLTGIAVAFVGTSGKMRRSSKRFGNCEKARHLKTSQPAN